MDDCIFCKIAAGEIPSNKVYEDDRVAAFYDIEPQAPKHILVVPKRHFTNMMCLQEEDSELLMHIFKTITLIAEKEGFAESGFRVVINTGKDGVQTVEHLHFHVLAGRMMEWPPG